MTNKKQFAFERGWENAKAKDQPAIRAEIMEALKLTTDVAFMQRRRGGINHRVTEAADIERVFKKYGVEEIWGGYEAQD